MQNVILTPVAVPELVDLIACEVESRIKSQIPQEPKSKTYLSKKQVKERYGLSYPTIDRYFDGYRIGGRIVYDEKECDSVLTKIQKSNVRK